MAGELLRVGRVPGRGRPELWWRLMWAVTFGGVAVSLAYHWATDPTTRPWIIGTMSLLGATAGAALSLDSWVDPERGVLRQTCLRLLRWEVVLAEATLLRFQHNYQGMVMLQVRSRGRRWSVRVPVVADDLRGPRAQSPPVLRMLAEEVRHWAPAHDAVAIELDAQADHLEAGGPIGSSPVLVRHAGLRLVP